jgi:hypothetical protein
MKYKLDWAYSLLLVLSITYKHDDNSASYSYMTNLCRSKTTRVLQQYNMNK